MGELELWENSQTDACNKHWSLMKKTCSVSAKTSLSAPFVKMLIGVFGFSVIIRLLVDNHFEENCNYVTRNDKHLFET